MGSSKVRNKVIVLDTEMTCDENQTFPNEDTEIIQVGFALFDITTREIEQPIGFYVKPEKGSISKYCENLTGITQNDVDTKGITLKEVSEILIGEYKSKKRIIATYGSDVFFFHNECTKKNIQSPFWLDSSFNIHQLFKMKIGKHKNTGLSSALKYFNLDFEGTPHDAKWDSFNTAKLLRELLK